MSSFTAKAASNTSINYDIHAKTTKVIFTLTSANDNKVEVSFKAACLSDIVVAASLGYEEEDQLEIDVFGVSVATMNRAKAFMEHYYEYDRGAFKAVLGSASDSIKERPRLGASKDGQMVLRAHPLRRKFEDIDMFYADIMDLEMISEARKEYSRSISSQTASASASWATSSSDTSVIEMLEVADKLKISTLRQLVIAKIVEMTKGNTFLENMELFKCAEEDKQKQRDVQTSKDKSIGYLKYDSMAILEEQLKFAFKTDFSLGSDEGLGPA